MSRARTSEILRGYVLGNWTACPIAVDNLGFSPDDSDHTAPFTPAQIRGEDGIPPVGYVLMRIRPVDSYRITLGENARWRWVDLVSFEIRTPPGQGTDLADTISQDLEDLFRDLQIVDAGPPILMVHAPGDGYARAYRIGLVDDWWVDELDVKIYRDETAASVGTGSPLVGGRARPSYTFTDAGHGFTVPTAVYVSGGSHTEADAGTLLPASGIVTGVSGDSYTVTTSGYVACTHGLGASGDIWLGASGAIVTSEPAVKHQRLGSIVSASMLLVDIGEMIE